MEAALGRLPPNADEEATWVAHCSGFNNYQYHGPVDHATVGRNTELWVLTWPLGGSVYLQLGHKSMYKPSIS